MIALLRAEISRNRPPPGLCLNHWEGLIGCAWVRLAEARNVLAAGAGSHRNWDSCLQATRAPLGSIGVIAPTAASMASRDETLPRPIASAS